MSLSRLIRSCAETNSISNGKAIHARLIISGSIPYAQINNHLLIMYSKHGYIDYAQKLFDRMLERNLVTWTALISAYSQMGSSEKSLNHFRSMILDDGISPNDYTYVAAISACADVGALRNGKEIHGRIYRMEESVNRFVNNCLVNFYGKCGSVRSARLVFDAINEVNTVSYVSVITSYMQCGEYEEVLTIFLRSLRTGVKVNEFLYGSVLGACAAIQTLQVGRQIQCLAMKCGVKMDQFVVTALINFYAKCGKLELARKAFMEANKPNVTAWTALIGGCMQLGKGLEAIHLFEELTCADLEPDEQTFASVLGAYAYEKEIEGGIRLHCLIIKMGFESFTFVLNALLDFYAKTNHLDDSLNIFCEMDVHETTSWNALIAGRVNSGHCEEAIGFIQKMFQDGIDPDLYTYSSLLSVCGDLPVIEWGKQTHCCVLKLFGLDFDVVIGSALTNMYAKCGHLNNARKVFDILSCKNIVTWSAMIAGYAQHGCGKEALEIYNDMLKNRVKPNDVIFVGVLASCVHVGALDEALYYFHSMIEEFGIIPREDHIACIVSLFARTGQTERAYDFIMGFPGVAGKVVWRCLLSGCATNKDLELAKYAAERILSIDPNDTSGYVMLSNIYADSNMWNEASQIRKLMKEKALKKETGYSWT